MRFVHVVHEPFDAARSGANLRDRAINLALRKLGEVVTVAVLPHLPSDHGWHDRRIARTYFAIPAETCTALTRRIAGEKPDLVVLSAVGLSPLPAFLLDAPNGCKTPLVADMHNAESHLLAELDRARLPAILRPLAPILFVERWRRARQVERALADQMAAVWMCAHDDRTRFRHAVGNHTPVHVIPNPVPAWCARRVGSAGRFEGSAPRVLYVGHLGYPPNDHAARYLAGCIWPNVRARWPGAELIVAGRHPRRHLKAYLENRDGVRLVPDPPDMARLYDQADAALLPIFEGGGSRIKVLEALAAGLPVVATPKAVEGLALRPDHHFLPAERAAEYVAAMIRLADDRDFRDRLIRQGREFAFANHSEDAIGRAVAAAVQSTMARATDRFGISARSA